MRNPIPPRAALAVLHFAAALLPAASPLRSAAQDPDRNYAATHRMLDSCGTRSADAVAYSDGLGRRVLSCSRTGPSAYAAELTLYGYGGEVAGRHVPVAGDGGWMSVGQASASGQSLHPGETRFLTELESDALGRPVRELGPGASWEQGGHAVLTSYGTNAPGEVRLYRRSGMSVVLHGHYAAGTLRRVTETDEDGLARTSFTDLQGRTVMTRDNAGGETYYVLDAWGDPVAVLPPGASAAMASGGPWSLTTPDGVGRWCYAYGYDARRRRVSVRLPGCGETVIRYDTADRPVFTQDPVQRGEGRCSFTLYDRLGRTAATGTCLSAGMVAPSAQESTAEYTGTGPYGGYTCPLALQDAVLLSVTWYDGYGFLGTLGDSSLEAAPLPGHPSQAAPASGLVTGTAVYAAGGGGLPLLTAFYYDAEGRVLQRRSTNTLGGHEVTATAYTFTGNPSRVTHVHTAPGKETVTETAAYTYDSSTDRPISVAHSVNGAAPVTLAAWSYDAVGRVAAKTTGGVETSTYTYNVRSWPTKIAGQRFTERLCYDGPVEGLDTSRPHRYRWNGTVAAYAWKTAGETRQRGYSLMYDGLDRLTAAYYGEGTALGSYYSVYDGRAAYDEMGNPVWIYRKSPVSVSGAAKPSSASDRLRLEYDGNRLVHVTDSVTSGHSYAGAFHFADGANAGIEYEYDANGNMVKDLNRNISSIQYNSLNLPSVIQFGDNSYIEYTYSASGEKLRVTYGVRQQPVLSPAGSVTSQSSVSEEPDASGAGKDAAVPGLWPMDMNTVVYCGNMVYDRGERRLLTDEGYVTFAADGTPQYHFYLRDHLGNIRVVFDQTGAVEQVTHYYPFGGVMRESTNPGLQPYKYGGKELDRTSGLDAYDFGARMYFADRLQWGQMDPFCEKYYDVSPYGYCHNNPIIMVDQDGKDDYRFDSKTGTFHLMEKTEDKADRVCSYKYDKKTGEYQKRKGLLSSNKMSNIEKGILTDGLNLMNDDLLISVGGDNNPSVQGVKEFALGLSELISREIAGLGYSANGSGEISDIVIGKYKKNTYTSSLCFPTAIINKYKESYTPTNIFLDFHTHPDGELGATQSTPELSRDIQIMRRTKENAPKAKFLVLYRSSNQMEEYDYTGK